MLPHIRVDAVCVHRFRSLQARAGGFLEIGQAIGGRHECAACVSGKFCAWNFDALDYRRLG
jgi:hypothetical protein